MKPLLLSLAAALLCCTVSAKSPKTERLLLGGSGWNKIAVIDKASGRILWSYPIVEGEECNSVQMTKSGDILYAYRGGARLVSYKNKQVIWDYKAPERTELHTARQNSDGTYYLAMCGFPARIVELDKQGVRTKEITFDTEIRGLHSQLRQVSKARSGHYLAPLMGKGEVWEIDGGPKDDSPVVIVRKVTAGRSLFSVQEQPDGRWLVSCGDTHRFVYVNPETGERTEVSSQELKDVSLLFVAQTETLKNGNILLSNWGGHSNDRSQPKMVEFTPDFRVVWTLPDNPELGSVSAFWVVK